MTTITTTTSARTLSSTELETIFAEINSRHDSDFHRGMGMRPFSVDPSTGRVAGFNKLAGGNSFDNGGVIIRSRITTHLNGKAVEDHPQGDQSGREHWGWWKVALELGDELVVAYESHGETDFRLILTRARTDGLEATVRGQFSSRWPEPFAGRTF